jgi:hypothetical protein
MRHNTHNERLDIWQDDVRMMRVMQSTGTDWYAVTGWLILMVSATLTTWMLYKSVPLVVRLLVAVVD